MMKLIKQYWVGGLVLILVVAHAVIIGFVRDEAARIKVTASQEIPLGLYYVPRNEPGWMTQLRVHVIVPPEHRLAAKATIEHHRWYLHEAVEEKLRQLNPELLDDPVLLETKKQVQLAVNEALREELVERVLINDRVDIPSDRFSYRLPNDVIASEPIYTATTVGEQEQFEEVEKP